MRIYLLLVLVSCLCFYNAHAQQTLSGVVFENGTRIPLAGIRIQNTRTKLGTETDINGKFSMEAKVNDILVFQGFAYLTDTVLLTDLKPHDIFMLPGKTMLKQVDVHNQEIKVNGLRDTGRSKSPLNYNGQSMVYHVDKSGYYDGGVTFRLWYWKKDQHKQAKRAREQYEEGIKLNIDQVFSAANLVKYLPLKPQEINSFKSHYTPSVKAYTANDFNLLLYLNTSYKLFMKLPPEKRLADKLVE